MNNDYLITIAGKHTTDDNVETISLTTFGDYGHRDGKDYITYAETETTGYAGDITTVTLDGNRCATLERRGKTNSNLVMEKGQKHICHYETGYGNLTVGIRADVIENLLSPDGGSVNLRYKLDLNSHTVSTNELNITVKQHIAPRHA